MNAEVLLRKVSGEYKLGMCDGVFSSDSAFLGLSGVSLLRSLFDFYDSPAKNELTKISFYQEQKQKN